MITLLALTGCSPQIPKSIPKQTASYFATQSPKEAQDNFNSIAHASCLKAQEEGVVESSAGKDAYQMVMTAKSQNYKDYSAAYFDLKDKYELIWEADAFYSCSAWFAISMAQEANQESPIKVSFDSKTGHYLTTQDLGDFGISRMDYEIADGRISVAIDIDTKATRTIKYGALNDAELNVLKTAVEQFLAKQ